MFRPTFLAAALGFTTLLSLSALAGPSGGNVVAGNANIRTNGPQTDIVQTTSRAVIDWNQFNVGRNESVNFRQPNAQSSTLNRVTGGDPSQILGTITATGQVILLNPNGVLFGRDARVDVGGLIVTTSKLATDDYMAGRLNFSAIDRPGGSIVNLGTISVRDGGLAAFVAPHVRNDGLIYAKLGNVTLASGSSFTVDLAGDGLVSLAVRDADVRGLVDVQGNAINALVENTGTLATPSGRTVVMTAAFATGLVNNAINLGGIVRADRVVHDKNGAIVLSAANGNVNLTGEIAAPGGTFTVRRDQTLTSLDGDTAAALGRVLRAGTNVAVEATGRIDLADRVDGRGGASGAGLRLVGASVGLRHDIYTEDGAVFVKATNGAAEMLRPGTDIVTGRAWPMILTGNGDIGIEASRNVMASHLVTKGNVKIESFGGNVNIVASLGGDLGGTSPLGSLTVRALGNPDTRDIGNISEIYDVTVKAGGSIDLAATRN
ncbi:MAG: filamentous hemagglutinin N-terminal domain-containing protein, partial [Burkholderiales bacterium]